MARSAVVCSETIASFRAQIIIPAEKGTWGLALVPREIFGRAQLRCGETTDKPLACVCGGGKVVSKLFETFCNFVSDV